jgi:predicted Zn-dependent protease
MAAPNLPTTDAPAPDAPRQTRSPRRRISVASAGSAGLLLLLLLLAAWSASRPDALPSGVPRGEYETAELRLRKARGRAPRRPEILWAAGEAAARAGRLPTAVACFRAIPADDASLGREARLREGLLLVRAGAATDAERGLREFLSLAGRRPPARAGEVVEARKWLGYLLSVELRFEDRKGLLAAMHRDGQADVYDSKQYYFPNLLIIGSARGKKRLEDFASADPADDRLKIALGRYHVAAGDLDRARAVLDDVRRRRPGDLACAAALLELHFERDDWDAFGRVAAALPDYDPREPWLLTRMRGQYALHRQKWDEAVRQFKRVLGPDPANPACRMGLSRAYAALGRRDAAEEATRRSLVLSRIRVGLVKVTEDDPQAARWLASECRQAGLDEAADTFRRHAERIAAGSGAPARRPMSDETATPTARSTP